MCSSIVIQGQTLLFLGLCFRNPPTPNNIACTPQTSPRSQSIKKLKHTFKQNECKTIS